ncbi:MAG: AAA family ATPase, partial [bacterium]
MHGVAKSGKTILCLQVFRGAHLVEIHARHAKTLRAFWSTLREKLRLPAREIVASESMSDHSTEISVEGAVEANIFGVGGKLSPKVASKSDAATGRSITHEFEHSTDSQVIEALVRDQAVIVIDDFHWIAEDVQAEILRDLRPFLLRNGTLVVISVPERAEQILARDHEMSALCTVVEAPAWEMDEIAQIGRKGFSSLNMALDESQIRK